MIIDSGWNLSQNNSFTYFIDKVRKSKLPDSSATIEDIQHFDNKYFDKSKN